MTNNDADVHIFGEDNMLIGSFSSQHGTTVQDVLDTIGNYCVIRQGKTTIASKG